MSTSSKVPPYLYTTVIRFGECDPAGVMYFPRYFDLYHQAMESWFDFGMKFHYHDLVRVRKVGFPAVHAEADYSIPSEFGDRLTVELQVGKLGRTSVGLEYRIWSDVEPDKIRLKGRSVVVAMDLDEKNETFRRAIPIPDDIRLAMSAYANQ